MSVGLGRSAGIAPACSVVALRGVGRPSARRRADSQLRDADPLNEPEAVTIAANDEVWSATRARHVINHYSPYPA